MSANMALPICVAFLGGVAVALQAQFVGTMGRLIGTLESIFVTYVGGAILIAVCLLVTRSESLLRLPTVPAYLFTAGALGLVVIGSIGFTVPRLGIASVLTLVVASQLLVGLLIEHYGLFGAVARPVEATRFIGIALILGGTWLVVRS